MFPVYKSADSTQRQTILDSCKTKQELRRHELCSRALHTSQVVLLRPLSPPHPFHRQQTTLDAEEGDATATLLPQCQNK